MNAPEHPEKQPLNWVRVRVAVPLLPEDLEVLDLFCQKSGRSRPGQFAVMVKVLTVIGSEGFEKLLRAYFGGYTNPELLLRPIRRLSRSEG